MREPAKLRILVGAAVPPDPNSGAAGTVWQMNRALERRGHQVDEIWQADLGRRIRHGNLHYLLELPRAYSRQVRRRLKSGAYDVIELNQPHAYHAAEEHQRRQSPCIFINRSHGHEARVKEELAPWIAKSGVIARNKLRMLASLAIEPMIDRHWDRVARAADGFIVSSRDDGKFLEEQYKVAPDRIGVITQGISDAFCETSPQPLSEARRQKLIYVGQHAFIKGPQTLAQVVNAVLRQRTDCTFTWVCAVKNHPSVREMLAQSIIGRVRLVDWMPQDELIALLDQHGLFLFPSLFEGFGKAPLEAMSRGLAVIASRTGGMRDYIQDGVNGRLTTVGHVEEMVAAALQCIDNPDYARRLGDAARMTALEHTWDRCAEDVEEFYRRIQGMKRAAMAR